MSARAGFAYKWVIERREDEQGKAKYVLYTRTSSPVGPDRPYDGKDQTLLLKAFVGRPGPIVDHPGGPVEWEITQVIDTQGAEGWM